MSQQTLKRDIGLFGSIFMGLGSILGTGVFISLSIATEIAGYAVLIGIIAAGLLAIFNGLSSAQLAANHPVSGGTYEYGYHYLGATWGFIAGWMFLCAKSASAATAALGFSTYCLSMFGIMEFYWLTVVLAILIILLLTFVVLVGIERSNLVNTIIVSVTIGSLLFFVANGSFHTRENFFAEFSGWKTTEIADIFYATAILFVAYTGYGRIATLGEEVKEPQKTIPRAVILTLIFAMLIYLGVGTISIAVVGADAFGAFRQQGPLEMVAQAFSISYAVHIITIGAITAMCGVLLNLILGLSRVLLAMGRRKDMPSVFAHINVKGTTPTWSVIATAVIIISLVFIGNIKTTWSFSAFTVLIYYAITNLAACKIPKQKRYYPLFIPIMGFISCLFLALWIDKVTMFYGFLLIVVGIIYFLIKKKLK